MMLPVALDRITGPKTMVSSLDNAERFLCVAIGFQNWHLEAASFTQSQQRGAGQTGVLASVCSAMHGC